MTTPEPIVFLVDDDQAVREGFGLLLKSVGLKVKTHATAQEFLDSFDPAQPGCLVLDIRLPGMSGLQLQDKLAAQGINIPTIIVTGHGDVRSAVRAMKAGAIDFVEKPFNDQLLLEHIYEALDRDAKSRQQQTQKGDAAARLASLTPREHQVLELVVAGKYNKAIASELGLSHKTVEFHRSKIMAKMQADNVAELVRMTLDATAH